MDLLQRYKEQHPGEFRKPQWETRSDSFFIRLVIRLSGGIIRDTQQAIYVIVGVIIVIAIAIIFFLYISHRATVDTQKNLIPAEIS